MSGLDFSKLPMDTVINIINILIFYAIVRALVYKPVRGFLERRRAEIEKYGKDKK